jgi:exopolysaccharide biosynthesis polyprenyl glycosylphosphotransferase
MYPKNKMHFEISERKILLRGFDVAFVWIALLFAGKLFDFEYLILVPHFYYALVLALYINAVGTVFEMYDLQVASSQFQIVRSAILTASLTVLLFVLTPVLSPELPSNRVQILAFYLAVLTALLGWRLFYVAFLASNRFVQNVVLVCDRGQLEELITGLEKADPHYKIIAYVNTDNRAADASGTHYVDHIAIEELVSFVKEESVFEIVVASQKTEEITVELYHQLLRMLESGTTIREYNQVYEHKTQRIPVQFIARDFYKFFPFNRSNSNRLYLLTVSLFEIAISIVGLLICALLVPFIWLGNALGNRGPLFYTQQRVGKNGVVFRIFKFRSMVSNAESEGAVFSTSADRRVTVFGKFLRKTRLDEFPQFLNVLKGDMALIGPRPERPFFVAEIAEIMPFYETRHVIKPGLTGWAQVNYSYGESLGDSLVKLQYDLYYIKHRSIFLDVNIVFKTISTVLFYRGQ